AAGADEAHGLSQQYGGFTVPVGFISRLLMLDMEEDPTRGVTTIPMAVPSVQIPARVDKNHTSSVAGGITVGWRPETVAATASRMSMEQITITAHSLLGLSYVTEELLNDSAISWAALLEGGFRDAVSDAVIRARISGTGVGEPLGILNSPALVSVDTTGQTTSTVKGSNLVSMRSRAWRYSRAVWLANHDCYPQLAESHLALTS
ncbi:MAG: phage major capsid protein, partial [Burkholderiales bacterium]|nr:phage major capsid protein [Burkholderiales bacterium]